MTFRDDVVRLLLDRPVCYGCFSDDHPCGNPECDMWRELRDVVMKYELEEPDSPCASGCKPSEGNVCGGPRCT